MITTTQKKTAQAIVNIFETGTVLGDYGQVTLIPGDTGHLTFGRSQTTLGSGNLSDLIERYCDNPGARFSSQLSPFLARLDARDLTLDNEGYLHNILRATADDPVMRETQDEFFDNVYWRRAFRSALRLGVTSPLGIAVVYDSVIHGSWARMRNRTTDRAGALDAIGEQAWISAYVQTRRDWLGNHRRRDLRATVYRMDALRGLIDMDQWGLVIPLVVRGHEISMLALSKTPRGCFDGPQPGLRDLALQSPLARGLDVRLLQLRLSQEGASIEADGVFGRHTAEHVKNFQARHGWATTGMADARLLARLAD